MRSPVVRMVLSMVAALVIGGTSIPHLARALPMKAPVRVSVQIPAVHAGDIQMVTIQGLPSAGYEVKARMPNGETLIAPSLRSARGGVQWTFVQPPRTITRHSRRATVVVTADGSTYTASYSVAFSAVDVVVPHTPVAENSEVVLYAHARAGTPVVLQLAVSGLTTHRTLTSDAHGWVSLPMRATNAEPPWQPKTITLVASALTAGKREVARADFQVLPLSSRSPFRTFRCCAASRVRGNPQRPRLPARRFG